MLMFPLLSLMFLEGTAIGPEAWSSIWDALTAQISVQAVVGVLAAVVGTCVGFAFAWWGMRKVTRMIMAALKKGKVSI